MWTSDIRFIVDYSHDVIIELVGEPFDDLTIISRDHIHSPFFWGTFMVFQLSLGQIWWRMQPLADLFQGSEDQFAVRVLPRRQTLLQPVAKAVVFADSLILDLQQELFGNLCFILNSRVNPDAKYSKEQQRKGEFARRHHVSVWSSFEMCPFE